MATPRPAHVRPDPAARQLGRWGTCVTGLPKPPSNCTDAPCSRGQNRPGARPWLHAAPPADARGTPIVARAARTIDVAAIAAGRRAGSSHGRLASKGTSDRTRAMTRRRLRTMSPSICDEPAIHYFLVTVPSLSVRYPRTVRATVRGRDVAIRVTGRAGDVAIRVLYAVGMSLSVHCTRSECRYPRPLIVGAQRRIAKDGLASLQAARRRVTRGQTEPHPVQPRRTRLPTPPAETSGLAACGPAGRLASGRGWRVLSTPVQLGGMSPSGGA